MEKMVIKLLSNISLCPMIFPLFLQSLPTDTLYIQSPTPQIHREITISPPAPAGPKKPKKDKKKNDHKVTFYYPPAPDALYAVFPEYSS